MLVRFIPDLEDTSLGELFSEQSLKQLWYLTPGRIYQSIKIRQNKKSEIKLGRPKEFITIINDINDSRWFKPLCEERNEKLSTIIN